MKPTVPAFLVIFLFGGSLAAAAPGDKVFPATPLSLGLSAGPVTAPATYDPRKAAQGGFIFVVLGDSKGEDEAVRLSEGMIVEGEAFGRAAAQARAHGVPAVGAKARSDSGRLAMDSPIYGAAQRSAHFTFQPVERLEARVIEEGDAVTIDPENGTVTLYPEAHQQEELDLAQALMAYDGLRDGQALIHWWQARAGEPQPSLLGLELVSRLSRRVAEGAGRPEDLEAVRQAVAASLPAGERAVFQSAAGAAMTAARANARPKTATQPHPSGSWRQAVVAAGAKERSGKTIPQKAYRAFVRDAGVSGRIDEIASDASLPLVRKSQRIRLLFESAAIPPQSEAGLALSAALSGSGPFDLSSAEGALAGVAKADAAKALLGLWADFWAAGPLGARKRAGIKDAAPEVLISPALSPDFSGLLYTRVAPRPPGQAEGANSRAQAVVGKGRPDDLWSGDGDEYHFDVPSGGRLLYAALRDGSQAGKPYLSSEQIKRLAAAAQALDEHFGSPVQASFAFQGGALYVLSAQALQ